VIPRIVPAGDSVLVIELEERIDPLVNSRTIALAEAVARGQFGGVRDVVATYRSVAIHYDPLRVDYDGLIAAIERESHSERIAPTEEPSRVRIPVCYGGDLGPDLSEVAGFAGMSEDDVVRTHTSAVYRVFMLGFVAGFAYLGIVDERIAMPRRETPRLKVPAGAVGVAGGQTGVYPAETPGGWRLLGRTPVKPFDPDRADPFLMKAGDAVEFYAISRKEYDEWRSS
jgi:KipI family sensor histidine kinase inhibitor